MKPRKQILINNTPKSHTFNMQTLKQFSPPGEGYNRSDTLRIRTVFLHLLATLLATQPVVQAQGGSQQIEGKVKQIKKDSGIVKLVVKNEREESIYTLADNCVVKRLISKRTLTPYSPDDIGSGDSVKVTYTNSNFITRGVPDRIATNVIVQKRSTRLDPGTRLRPAE